MGSELARQVGKAGPRASVTAVRDIVDERAEGLAAELGAAVCPSCEAMLEREDVDAVIIATPNDLHCEQAVTAARAGKHVLTEKPMALTVADCTAMIDACRSAGVRLMVGQVLRYIGVFPEVERLLASGELGAPAAISMTRLSGRGWGTAGTTWRDFDAQTGGVLYEVHVHELDYQRRLFGDPIEVFATAADFVDDAAMDYEDLFMVTARFPGGRMGHLTAGNCKPGGDYRATVFCSGGSVWWTSWSEYTVQKFDAEPELRKAPSGGPSPYALELGDFVTALVEGTEPVIPGEEGRKSVAFCAAAVESARAGVVVRPDYGP
jgi:predicted dehydrogenase